MASASLPSSSSACGLKYDVFLSFRGIHVGDGVASDLHRQLTERGFKIYMDTNGQVADFLSPTRLKAIEESRFAIVILSPDYASSIRCLQEIAKICLCMQSDRIVRLFFNVEPDDVLLLKGSFEEAFTNYENSGLYRSETLQQWKDAFKKVANCKGWNLKDYKMSERELVKKLWKICTVKCNLLKTTRGILKQQEKPRIRYMLHQASTISTRVRRVMLSVMYTVTISRVMSPRVDQTAIIS